MPPPFSDRPTSGGDAPTAPASRLNPGDAATPGTGANVGPAGGGTGRMADGACADCGGSGKVTAGVGGA